MSGVAPNSLGTSGRGYNFRYGRGMSRLSLNVNYDCVWEFHRHMRLWNNLRASKLSSLNVTSQNEEDVVWKFKIQSKLMTRFQ